MDKANQEIGASKRLGKAPPAPSVAVTATANKAVHRESKILASERRIAEQEQQRFVHAETAASQAYVVVQTASAVLNTAQDELKKAKLSTSKIVARRNNPKLSLEDHKALDLEIAATKEQEKVASETLAAAQAELGKAQKEKATTEKNIERMKADKARVEAEQSQAHGDEAWAEQQKHELEFLNESEGAIDTILVQTLRLNSMLRRANNLLDGIMNVRQHGAVCPPPPKPSLRVRQCTTDASRHARPTAGRTNCATVVCHEEDANFIRLQVQPIQGEVSPHIPLQLRPFTRTVWAGW